MENIHTLTNLRADVLISTRKWSQENTKRDQFLFGLETIYRRISDAKSYGRKTILIDLIRDRHFGKFYKNEFPNMTINIPSDVVDEIAVILQDEGFIVQFNRQPKRFFSNEKDELIISWN